MKLQRARSAAEMHICNSVQQPPRTITSFSTLLAEEEEGQEEEGGFLNGHRRCHERTEGANISCYRRRRLASYARVSTRTRVLSSGIYEATIIPVFMPTVLKEPA